MRGLADGYSAFPVCACVIVMTACGFATGQPVTLQLDMATTHQTIEGWGAMLPSLGLPIDEWIADPTPATYDEMPLRDPVPDQMRLKIIDDAVDELGLNRFRLEVGPQVEMVNDNADPRQTNLEAYRFRWQDFLIERWLLPLKRRIETRNEKLVLYISYDLRSSLTPEWLLGPDEYAEMAVATLTHLKQVYGLEADYWVVLNEPGNQRPGEPRQLASLVAKTGARIREAGFRTRIAGPEVVTPRQFDSYMKALEHTPGAIDQLGQLTYHLYWDPMSVTHRNQIRAWSRRIGVPVAQTEWLEGEGLEAVEALHLDLTEANASVWEQYALCWTANDLNAKGGGDYFVIQPDYSAYRMNGNARLLRQYMKYIRPGDVRVSISSSATPVRPVAFRRPDGRVTIVVINASQKSEDVRITAVAAGRYEGWITEEHGEAAAIPVQSTTSDGVLTLLIPARGTATIQQLQ